MDLGAVLVDESDQPRGCLPNIGRTGVERMSATFELSGVDPDLALT